MNHYTLSLSSSNTSHTEYLAEVELFDFTRFELDLSNVTEKIIPVYLKIDWGDETETHNNDVYTTRLNTINLSNYSPLLNNPYYHDYYPSKTALYKLMTLQILVRYSNGDYNYFSVPLKIRTHGYTESIGDLTLVNTNILPTETNNSEHQFKTSKDGYVIELRGD